MLLKRSRIEAEEAFSFQSKKFLLDTHPSHGSITKNHQISKNKSPAQR